MNNRCRSIMAAPFEAFDNITEHITTTTRYYYFYQNTKEKGTKRIKNFSQFKNSRTSRLGKLLNNAATLVAMIFIIA
ncbi:hypothetical protein KIN20_009098 [Parelaphostrongylus tenuis]|uniref:Uncharacterized protein n=1 Tax=Parelaphostrongylus tenuis TaxID=148309 RepID=A0AAD5MRC4_PARTN|nr:hypothetical protein KIN20_009098 [Parelaphostrongylus tenuis]